jgi:hypothetical protein
LSILPIHPFQFLPWRQAESGLTTVVYVDEEGDYAGLSTQVFPWKHDPTVSAVTRYSDKYRNGLDFVEIEGPKEFVMVVFLRGRAFAHKMAREARWKSEQTRRLAKEKDRRPGRRGAPERSRRR